MDRERLSRYAFICCVAFTLVAICLGLGPASVSIASLWGPALHSPPLIRTAFLPTGGVPSGGYGPRGRGGAAFLQGPLLQTRPRPRTASSHYSTAGAAQSESQWADLYVAAWTAVAQSFVDRNFSGLNWAAVKAKALAHGFRSAEATHARIRADIAQLGDPFTRFIDPAQYSNLNRRLNARVPGVGLGLAPAADSDAITVVEVLPGGAAEGAGILVGDVLVAVDGTPADGRTHWQLCQAIGGDADGVVTLLLHTPAGAERTLTLPRQSLPFKPLEFGVCAGVRGQRWGGGPLATVGYVRIPTFCYNSFPDFLHAMQQVTEQGVEGVVLDLRGNTGGSVQAAYSMASALLESGEIVRIVGRDGSVRAVAPTAACHFPAVPLAVLVDGRTASSGEVLAAALALQGRAVLAGAQTFGKGRMQSIHVLPDQSAVVVTVERYLTPAGDEIDGVGLRPAVAVEHRWLDLATGLPPTPAGFCAALTTAGRGAPSLFSGPPPTAPVSPRPVPNLDRLPAFC